MEEKILKLIALSGCIPFVAKNRKTDELHYFFKNKLSNQRFKTKCLCRLEDGFETAVDKSIEIINNFLKDSESLDGEEWKPIPNFDGYFISNMGRVKSTKSKRGPRNSVGKILKGGVDKDGYKRLVLMGGSKKRESKRIAHLVAESFLPAKKDGQVLRHLNGNNQDNRASNLKYGTQKENILDKRTHGTLLFGEKVGNAILTEKQAIEIYNSKEFASVLAEKYGVSKSCIENIKYKRNWKYLHK